MSEQKLVHDAWYVGIPTKPAYGDDPKTGRLTAVVVMKIIEGPCAGREVKYYNAKWARENNVFTFRKLRACGWQGKDPDTIVPDIEAALQAGRRVRFQARWVEIGNGFWSADNMQGDEVYVQPVTAPSQDSRAMMRQALADAAEDDRRFQEQRAAQRSGGSGGAPRDLGPHDDPRHGAPPPQLKEGDWCTVGECDAVIVTTPNGGLSCTNGHEVVPF